MWVEDWGDLPGHLIVISGPSGSGKSTLIHRALRRPDVAAQLSVSATTREKRPSEAEGVDYHFLSFEEFRAGVDQGFFLEWAEYNRNYYGTPKAPIFEAMREGRSVILEIEVQGAKIVRDLAPGAVFVFVKTPRFNVLEDRLRERGSETGPSILRRLRHARHELGEAHWYDYQIVNDDLGRAVEDLAIILKSNGC